MSIFFQKEENNYNAVIIELKGLGTKTKSKFEGLQQLRKYARTFKEQNNIKNTWYYLITNIDNDFAKELENDDYKLLFSNDDKVYFRYFEKMNLYLYVMSEEALIADARARNKIFLDIIRDNSRDSSKDI